jgi:hypothetical protein
MKVMHTVSVVTVLMFFGGGVALALLLQGT